MLTKDFYFDLPQELIAQHPSAVRGADKVMHLNRASGAVQHYTMDDVPQLIAPGTLMLFNNSRVRRSRVYGTKLSSGSTVEFMFLNQIDAAGCQWNCMVKAAKRQKPGMQYRFDDGSVGTIIASAHNEGTEFRTVQFDCAITEAWFEANGHIPLPPYIRRADTDADSERYQNVYATQMGSSACPTAGLHFTTELLQRLRTNGVEMDYITLHVGLGTFLPVRAERIEDHVMHEEVFTISEAVAEKVQCAKKEGRPVLAVGTTTVRTLESAAAKDGTVHAGTQSTRIFMYPGYQFRVVDQLFTNFHTPESTLIMLVSAFAGREHVLAAYKQAIAHTYRFFSYGDAMLIQ